MLFRLIQQYSGSPWGSVPVRALLAALTALVACLATGPAILRLLARAGVGEKTEKTPIQDDELRRSIAAKSGTPTMGGFIVLAGLVPACLLWADVASALFWPVLGCTAAMGAVGFADDYLKLRGKGHTARGLKVRHKLLFQGLAGAGVGLALLQTDGPWQGLHGLWLPAALLWAALVVATMSNATNITDGLDGLLAGLVPPAALAIGAACWAADSPASAAALNMAHVAGAGELAVFCGAMLGACLGFLRFNRHPARVFLGDTGSMALGGGLAAVALAARLELLLGIAGVVFLLEFASSLLQIGSFQLTGRRILPVAPLHHIFQKQGHPETAIVRGFYVAGLSAALLTFAFLWL